MAKFGKKKLKTLNKLVKKQNVPPTNNKVIKKKLNAEKKVSFHKEVLLKQVLKNDGLVRITKPPPDKSKENGQLQPEQEVKVNKVKAVNKKNKRRKSQISDMKLLLSLMKKK